MYIYNASCSKKQKKNVFRYDRASLGRGPKNVFKPRVFTTNYRIFGMRFKSDKRKLKILGVHVRLCRTWCSFSLSFTVYVVEHSNKAIYETPIVLVNETVNILLPPIDGPTVGK